MSPLSTRERLPAFLTSQLEGIMLRFVLACTAAFALMASSAYADNIIHVSVSGKGIVTAGSSISCGNGQTKCDAQTKGLGGVELKANPASGAKFEGWSGKCTPQGATCWVPVYDDGSTIEIEASFSGTSPVVKLPSGKRCPPYCPKVAPIKPENLKRQNATQ
jgi:hypothetical protein